METSQQPDQEMPVICISSPVPSKTVRDITHSGDNVHVLASTGLDAWADAVRRYSFNLAQQPLLADKPVSLIRMAGVQMRFPDEPVDAVYDLYFRVSERLQFAVQHKTGKVFSIECSVTMASPRRSPHHSV